jgi:hypothetical protein
MSSVLSELTSGDPHLSPGERAISVVLGLALAAAAAKPRPNPLLNLVALVGGSLLAYRGATGYCHVKAALGDRGQDSPMARRQPEGGYGPTGYAPGDRLGGYPGTNRVPEPHGSSIPNSI